MEALANILKFLHVISFVFMSVPLFNLIVVNERVALKVPFDYEADRYMENIIRNGAYRCFVFQTTVLVSGVLLLMTGPLGLEGLWTNTIVLIKTVLLVILMAMLSYVHFYLQPQIEALFASLEQRGEVPENFPLLLKPYRGRRKKMATLCLFLVITSIILGLQVYQMFHPGLTVALTALGGLFALKANKTLMRFGWV